MRKHSFLRVGACLTVSVLCAALLSGCKHKEITLDDEHIINYTAPAEGEEIAVLTVKDYGQIKIKLFPEEAPKGVENFKKLIEQGFYDELIFHRVVNTFVIQTGDPKGNGTGGSDENIVGEFSANGFTQNTLSHKRGVISMARSNDMNSASSQFFIVHKDSTFLDGQYAAFGEVTDGMEVVDKIATDAKPVDGNGTIPSSKQPVINSVTIERAQ